MSDNISTLFPMLLSQFNAVIDADIPIQTGYIDVETRKRYWKIDGLATVYCGGTHVKSTSEIGYVSLKRKRANKGVERVYISLENP